MNIFRAWCSSGIHNQLSGYPQEVGSQFRGSLIRGIALLKNGYPILKRIGYPFLKSRFGYPSRNSNIGYPILSTDRVPEAILKSGTRFFLESGTRFGRNRVPDLKTQFKPVFSVFNVIFIS